MGVPVQLMAYRPRRSARRDQAWVDRLILRGVVLLFALVLATSIILALTAPARAAGPSAYDGFYTQPIQRAPVDGDTALERPEPVQAPKLAQTIRLDIAGIVARGSVTQTFRNDSADWVEGEYRFPLPDGAAVDQLKITVADRVIEGVIKEREEAKKTYEAAKAKGQTAALLDENRPNLFNLKIANIGPGEVIQVALEFQAPVTRESGGYALTMPLVSAPRYIPPVTVAGFDHPALRDTIARQMADAERLGFPVDLSRQSNPTAMEISLDAGAELATLESPSHDLVVSHDGSKYRIGLREGSEPADRDMILRWSTEKGDSPGATLFHERVDGTDYLLAMILPPKADVARKVAQPRDVTFVIDSSGSMFGEAMEAAQIALMEAISALQPQDSFDIIDFDSSYQALFGAPRPAGPSSKDAALRFTAGLDANGGTEMAGPLRAALSTRPNEGSLRQIVFLTDGLVGNEDELFRMIGANLGQARLFTVGLGAAPNGWFMRKAAELGAGQNLSIQNVDEAADRMRDFYRQISVPVVTDMTLNGGGRIEALPNRLPDLYDAQAILVPIAIKGWDGRLTLTGTMAGKPWTVRMTEADSHPAKGIAKLWAERKVETILDGIRRGEIDEDEGRLAVLDIAIPHRITSKYTSFVALDKVVRRDPADPLRHGMVPNNLPQGMSAQHVMGPAGADGWMEQALIGIGLILLSLLLLLAARRIAEPDSAA